MSGATGGPRVMATGRKRLCAEPKGACPAAGHLRTVAVGRQVSLAQWGEPADATCGATEKGLTLRQYTGCEPKETHSKGRAILWRPRSNRVDVRRDQLHREPSGAGHIMP